MSDEGVLDFQKAAATFYDTLFRELPALRIHFESEQKRFLMFAAALKCVQDLGDNEDRLVDYLRMLGSKHRSIGLSETHMAIGRKAFIQAIEVGGTDMSIGDRERFVAAFDALYQCMGFENAI